MSTETSIATGLRELATVVEAIEDAGHDVVNVDTDAALAGGQTSIDVSLSAKAPTANDTADDAAAEVHTCEDCGKEFETDTGLAIHVGQVHKDAPDEADDTDEDSATEPAEWADVHTPDWLDEASFYAALDESDDVEDLARTLGWEDGNEVADAVEQLDVADRLGGAA